MTSDERSALLPRRHEEEGATRATSSKSKSSNNCGLMVWRVFVVLCLAGLAGCTVYQQQSLIHLRGSLETQESKMQTLEQKIKQHDQTMERFNASVTQSDVLTRLDHFQAALDQTQHHLEQSLVNVKADITQQLNNTMRELDETVTKAEQEITNEVNIVKKEVKDYVTITEDKFSTENSFMVYQLAGTFTLLACLISMWHMTAHLRKMNQPDVQRKILAILWMVPIYGLTSWFSLVFPEAEGYLAIIKDAYEAYIIYQFLSFCISVLGKGDRSKVVDLLAQHADHLTPPMQFTYLCERCCGCCKAEAYTDHRALADAVLLQCQVFAMQFVFFRPFTTTANVILAKLEYTGAGSGATDPRSPQFYLFLIQNLSIFFAFTGLLKFYHAVDKDLAWCRPFAKFLCIKGIVFMTFWQGLAVSLLADLTDATGGEDPIEWSKSVQNFLICLEMLIFAIAHFYCFPTEEWEDGYRVKHSSEKNSFSDSIALGDFFSDLKLIMTKNKKKKKRSKKQPKTPSTIPEGKEDDDDDDNNSEANTADYDSESEATSATNSNHRGGSGSSSGSLKSSADDEDDDDDMVEALIHAYEKKSQRNLQGEPSHAGSAGKNGSSKKNQGEQQQDVWGEKQPLISSSASTSHEPYQADLEGSRQHSNDEEEEQPPAFGTGMDLRPSIFTTVANLVAGGEQEEEDDDDQKKRHDKKS